MTYIGLAVVLWLIWAIYMYRLISKTESTNKKLGKTRQHHIYMGDEKYKIYHGLWIDDDEGGRNE